MSSTAIIIIIIFSIHHTHLLLVGNNRRAAKNAPPAIGGETPEVLEPETTITLSVPDELVGNILGNKVTRLD
jgi:hypothetical protein